AWTTTSTLSQVTVSNIGTYHQFSYDSSGELTHIQLPYRGYLAYDYSTMTYSNGRSYREVLRRYLSKDGSTQTTYPFYYETNNPDVHSVTALDDPSGSGEKKWFFYGSGTFEGLVSNYQGIQLPTWVVLVQNDFYWTQDAAANSSISATVSKADPGQSYQ